MLAVRRDDRLPGDKARRHGQRIATVSDAAGGTALTHVGRLLAELLIAKQTGRPLAEEGHRSGEGEPD